MDQFELLKISRENLLERVRNFSEAQLNHIPEGFNNNLIWHMGHLVVTQQLLCYRLSGLEANVSEDWINRYRKGTQPEGLVGSEEIEQIKALLRTSVAQMQEDYQSEHFREFKTYQTSYGVMLKNIEDALVFNNLHEGVHYGYVLAMAKLI